MIYPNATVTVLTAATSPRDRTKTLTPVDVTGVTFSIVGPGNVALATDVAMLWDATIRRYAGEWTTPANAPGEYLAEVVWHGLNGSRSVAWRTFHVEPTPTV